MPMAKVAKAEKVAKVDFVIQENLLTKSLSQT